MCPQIIRTGIYPAWLNSCEIDQFEFDTLSKKDYQIPKPNQPHNTYTSLQSLKFEGHAFLKKKTDASKKNYAVLVPDVYNTACASKNINR